MTLLHPPKIANQMGPQLGHSFARRSGLGTMDSAETGRRTHRSSPASIGRRKAPSHDAIPFPSQDAARKVTPSGSSILLATRVERS
jgi:hypothetical protein